MIAFTESEYKEALLVLVKEKNVIAASAARAAALASARADIADAAYSTANSAAVWSATGFALPCVKRTAHIAALAAEEAHKRAFETACESRASVHAARAAENLLSKPVITSQRTCTSVSS